MSRRTALLATPARSCAAALVACLVASLALLAPAPARADGGSPREVPGHGPSAVFKRSSYLCYGYVDCRNKGMGNDGYAAANDKMYWRMYSGHNCTNYAAYRMVRSGMPNVRPWSGGGNAMYWGTSMPDITNGTPRVGAVAWWKANAGPAGSVGHVAYVEKVVSADEVIISQDSWGGDFSWAVITRASGNWPSGFIHFNDRPLTNRSAPVITGVAKVGSLLRATSGSWAPTDVTVAYQWWANGRRISGATHTGLRLTTARLGQVVTVTTTASKLGYPTRTARSAPTAAVLPGTLQAVTTPQISGEPRVDSVLTLDTGTWNPTPDGLTVRWLADGQPIEGATGGTSLPLTPDLVGTAISATVTATRSGYAPVTVAAPATTPVAPGTFAVTDPPSVQGTVTFGQTLTVDLGSYQPAASGVAVQWLRNGQPIEGATAATYQIQNVDLGSRLSVRVTLTRAGYTTRVVDSAPTIQVKSDPEMHFRVEKGRSSVRVLVTVSAPGVDVVTGNVVARIGGKAATVPLRNGAATLRITDIRSGERTLWVRYAGSDTVHWIRVSRPVRLP
ncbi:CHAP domain-containing protein [Nocardioides sp.]|uniref:CHAP domain-containing protein n=1 Tax=Nocardioides sp. TaxID=35761 RepID=UPI003783B0E8